MRLHVLCSYPSIDYIIYCFLVSLRLFRAIKSLNDSLNECWGNLKRACTGKAVDTEVTVTQFPSDSQTEKWNEWLKSNKKKVSTNDLIILDLYYRTFDIKVTFQVVNKAMKRFQL